MPLYDIKCSASSQVFERMIKLHDFEAPIICTCGSPAIRVISRPMFTIDNVDYTCPVTDKWIGSKNAHRDNLRKQGCRVLEPGEKEASTRNRANEELSFERSIEDTVEREIESYPSDKKERLYNEMINSDIAVERG